MITVELTIEQAAAVKTALVELVQDCAEKLEAPGFLTEPEGREAAETQLRAAMAALLKLRDV